MKRSKAKAWMDALRLRTLPLSISGSIVAAGIAQSQRAFSWGIFILILLTASFLQILSNMANDYGDFSKGTDNENRVGPARALQRGEITARELLIAMCVVCAMCMVAGLTLVIVSLGVKALLVAGIFILLGAGCILAAIKYTVGKKAYGYVGLGEVFVFLFFGLVSITGGLFLYTGHFYALSLLPGAAIGLLSSGVLNLNNMRDVENDKISGKNTLASHMSIRSGKIYQSVLILLAMLCFGLYQKLTDSTQMWYLISVICLLNVYSTMEVKERSGFDKYLKVLSLSTFAIAILFSVIINL
ncbi:MAG: 1,4-dihydroxy-2-naphthoate octaprenyltransferase [Flavobacteriales bacterium]|nr:1,4-dihydroxy-2-naphthoate octaprenyltransferase [Flavobacteriales bacterium]